MGYYSFYEFVKEKLMEFLMDVKTELPEKYVESYDKFMNNYVKKILKIIPIFMLTEKRLLLLWTQYLKQEL